MAYYTALFSPETYEAFLKTDMTVAGFRKHRERIARRVRRGDKLLCYVTKVSAWAGILEIKEGPYLSSEELFVEMNDPFVLRFSVLPIACLPLSHALSIRSPNIWDNLSFTSNLENDSIQWVGMVRMGLMELKQRDGSFLEEAILKEKEKLT